MTGNNPRMDNRGFTLLEVVIAAAVLTIGFMGTAGLMILSIKSHQASLKMTTATILAQEKIERLRQAAYHGIDASGTQSIEGYKMIPDHPSFQRIVKISEIPGVSGAKTVSVTVSWKGPDRRSVQLATIVAK